MLLNFSEANNPRRASSGGLVLGLGQRHMTSPKLLQHHGVALKLCLDPLKLLLGSIALDGSESSSRGGFY
jgi:hypothetical protein